VCACVPSELLAGRHACCCLGEAAVPQHTAHTVLRNTPTEQPTAPHPCCRQLGVSALVAICCIAAAVPINSRLVAASAAKLRVALKHGDTRAKLETELVTGALGLLVAHACVCVCACVRACVRACVFVPGAMSSSSSSFCRSSRLSHTPHCHTASHPITHTQAWRWSRRPRGRRPSTSASQRRARRSWPCCASHCCCRCAQTVRADCARARVFVVPLVSHRRPPPAVPSTSLRVPASAPPLPPPPPPLSSRRHHASPCLSPDPPPPPPHTCAHHV
jgi:hypothetical protein